ncbi:RNA-binding domain-containing protein, partial [Neoconidiobolus thromboides FSU 785]
VWVGNLRFTTTEQELRRFFADCGKVTRVNLPATFSRNKGFAYVDFETEESQKKAIEKSEQELIGRNVLIKDAKNFVKNGKKAPALKAVEAEKEGEVLPTIFVGNLSFETTKEHIQEVFEKYGEIKKVRISTFEDTGRCKGYAWVDFKEQNSATQALRAFQKRKLNGRSLKVMYA